MFVATINLLKIRKCVSSEDQKGSEYNESLMTIQYHSTTCIKCGNDQLISSIAWPP